ncbi:MAG: hypothetical protein GWO22_10220, partial [Actinobacteria bacterium]|nr:hypothetical protein [Actinomycetota bacterium]
MLAIGVALFIANSLDLEWMSVTVVLVGGVWALDMADAGGRRGLPVAAIPVLAGITGGVIATYRFGAPGTAAATVLAAIGVIVWAIVAPRFRPMDS